MAISINHPLFETMKVEHQQIQDQLEKVERAPLEHLQPTLQLLWKLVEAEHHEKEEKLLFQFIYKKPAILAGGPMCSLFFDSHLRQGHKNQVEKAINESVYFEPHQSLIVNSRNPLIIPIEEHQSGKFLLRYLLSTLDTQPRSKIQSLLRLYSDLQLEHIKKEENCMYLMIADLLSADEANSILKNWKEWDNEKTL